jgi:transcriptional regulator with XRE-family HTH domain
VTVNRFGTHLRRLREQKGMTRYRLAKLSGISSEGVSKLERPGSDPKLSTLYKVAAALGITIWDLLPDQGTARRTQKNKAARRGACDTPPD